uniref:DHC_N2 domain-containing protein n=1 Tax=Parastrongyloides trichosuri TaxID=131310 RepID=A0A0N4ZCE7_PARTI
MDTPLIRKKEDKEKKFSIETKLIELNALEVDMPSKKIDIFFSKNRITPIVRNKKFNVIKRTLDNLYPSKNKSNLSFFRKQRIKREIDYSKFDAEKNLKEIMKRKKEDEEAIRMGNLPINLKNLKRLERYQIMAQHVKNYIEKINKHNERTLKELHNPLIYQKVDSIDSGSDIFSLLESLTKTLEDVILKNYKMSFFSPKLFNIMPSCSTKNCKEKRKLFSPTLFSFHRDDGFFSLPDILQRVMFNDEEENKWLNFIFDVTGAAKTLNLALNILNPMIDEMENKIYPAIVEFEKMEEQYRKMLDIYDEKQMNEIENDGYTFLYEDQLKMIYNNSSKMKLKFEIDDIKNMTRLQLEERIEYDIRQIASIKSEKYKTSDYAKKKKRATTASPRRTTTEEDPAAKDAEDHEVFNTLQPFAFFNRIGEPIIIEVQTLSPHAFIYELFSPEILVTTTLSPRAFIATILSPNILVARILQPAAFRMEVLAPRILTAWVLSPEFLLLEVLSPKIIDPKVLSPEYLKIVVLSPTMVSPRVVSQEGLGVLILSPNILSPNVLSRESLIVEILSPHIFGGQEHTESGESSEGEANGEHKSNEKEHGHHSEFHPVHIHTYPFDHLQMPHTFHIGD